MLNDCQGPSVSAASPANCCQQIIHHLIEWSSRLFAYILILKGLKKLSKIGPLFNAEPAAFDVVIILAVDPYD